MSARVYDIEIIGYGIQMSAALKDIAVSIYNGTYSPLVSNNLDGVVERLSPGRFKDMSKRT